jgi:hypothetical protein
MRGPAPKYVADAQPGAESTGPRAFTLSEAAELLLAVRRQCVPVQHGAQVVWMPRSAVPDAPDGDVHPIRSRGVARGWRGSA